MNLSLRQNLFVTFLTLCHSALLHHLRLFLQLSSYRFVHLNHSNSLLQQIRYYLRLNLRFHHYLLQIHHYFFLVNQHFGQHLYLFFLQKLHHYLNQMSFLRSSYFLHRYQQFLVLFFLHHLD